MLLRHIYYSGAITVVFSPMAEAEAQFMRTGLELRANLNNNLTKANQEHCGKLDLAQWLQVGLRLLRVYYALLVFQGRDPAYLGINRGNYYAKPFGNDSSNIQAVIGGMSYWKRVCYRPDDVLKEVLGVEDEKFSAENSGYKQIRESMKVKKGHVVEYNFCSGPN